jgi:peroxiredoxin
MMVPSLAPPFTDGTTVDLAARSPDSPLVAFGYPRTGVPGARGCTPQACSFRDLAQDFARLGAAVFGLSTLDTVYQAEAAERLGLPYSLISDASLRLTQSLSLPTFAADSVILLRRLTLIIVERVVGRSLHPVFPPDQPAAHALNALAIG